ncbi:putative meiotically up-regulated protein [Phaeomoniella chlamydospora]|uniref:Putative meiotically up-regulated protein n=1 Tax=Phaeomoniella chlamydospora TaxID=158046 RepID=A0A0G2DY20_PHACM|nr:putative meiotically up-regulated protein [Phaeomoniella chlamydospora]
MGQGHSSAGGGSQATEPPVKRDYYELLGVERQATDDEYDHRLRLLVPGHYTDVYRLKKAYRRKALELHPDRNYGNVEEATKLFAEIQSAYEVLSDPQERAWYDSHRDVLLRGETPGEDGEEYSYDVRMTTSEEVLKLMMKFNGRLSFNDSPSGFYGGLNEFFEKLAREEDIACQWEDLEPVDYPSFGHKEDDFVDVVRPFYAIWNGFATRKTYSWKDKYRLSDAPDRRVRRLMEKENKHLREDAVRQFNDAVRSLVAFVRKRDPRYQENVQSEAERQKTLREAAKAQAARSRAANLAQMEQHVIPDWAKSQQPEDDPFSEEEEEEESDKEHIECVVCNKTFKSEKQFEAHEKSKKHIKLLKQLKREMKHEDTMIDMEGDPKDEERTLSDNEIEHQPEADTIELPPEIQTPTDTIQKRANVNSQLTDSESDDNRPSPLKPPPKDPMIISQPSSPTASPPSPPLSDLSEEDSDYAPRAHVASRLVSSLSLSEDIESSSSPAPTSKLGKAKKKRAKKAAATAAAEQTQKGTGSKTAEGNLACTICGEEFPSKTKLFTHVREQGHAALKSVVDGSGNGGGGAGGAKKKGKKR